MNNHKPVIISEKAMNTTSITIEKDPITSSKSDPASLLQALITGYEIANESIRITVYGTGKTLSINASIPSTISYGIITDVSPAINGFVNTI